VDAGTGSRSAMDSPAPPSPPPAPQLIWGSTAAYGRSGTAFPAGSPPSCDRFNRPLPQSGGKAPGRGEQVNAVLDEASRRPGVHVLDLGRVPALARPGAGPSTASTRARPVTTRWLSPLSLPSAGRDGPPSRRSVSQWSRGVLPGRPRLVGALRSPSPGGGEAASESGGALVPRRGAGDPARRPGTHGRRQRRARRPRACGGRPASGARWSRSASSGGPPTARSVIQRRWRLFEWRWAGSPPTTCWSRRCGCGCGWLRADLPSRIERSATCRSSTW
jgi:hypothetical protein